MAPKQKRLPSVLMLILSSLGILFSWSITTLIIWGGIDSFSLAEIPSSEALTTLSIGSLTFFIGLLNLPTLIYSIKKLKGNELIIRKPALFKSATLSLAAWLVLLFAGYWISQSQTALFALAPITILTIIIPIWWLIEFARRGLKRPSPFREWSTLTLGLTLNPVIIMTIEILLVIVVSLVVFFILGLQPGALTQLMEITSNPEIAQGGLEELERLLYDLAQDPLIATAIFLTIGVVAPFTEELFKPLVVWILPKRTINPGEGFILGLISGGAFTFLESASLVSQVGSQDWLISVLLRSATGLLHIGLSGLAGYGIAKARYEKRWSFALLYLLAAAVLHGLWNSMALLNGYSTTVLPVSGSTGAAASGTISIFIMLLVFASVLGITIKINRSLKHSQLEVGE